MQNLRTTVAGVLASVLAALTLLQKFLNGEPITLEEITMLGAIGASGGGLLSPRCHDARADRGADARASGAVTDAAAIFGANGPSLAVLVTLGLFALGGALARLFWDAATADFTVRRQIGFVGMSVVAAFALTFVAWERGRDYPAFLVGLATISALIGPADVLTLLRALFLRVVGGIGGGGK